jgi:hypothetical protein
MNIDPLNTDPTVQLAAQLRKCEETLLDPAICRDRARVAALLADDFVEFGASGKIWTREEILALLATEEYHPPVIESFECVRIAPDVALATYQAVRTDTTTGERSVTLRSSIWSKGPWGWRMRFHQSTRAL